MNTHLTDEQINRMILAATRTRDRLMLILMSELGGRIGEVLSIRRQDIDMDKMLIIMPTFKRRTKMARAMPIGPSVAAILRDYLATARSEFLFPSRKGRGSRPIGRIQAWRLVNDCAQLSGIPTPVRTIAFRHAFAHRMRSMPIGRISEAQKLMGHARAESSLGYINS